MAYLAFAEPGMPSVAAPAPYPASAVVEQVDAPASFSALEWSVVALAERDRLSSLRTPGRMALALGTLFGERTNPKLADQKLEALRRLAVLTWHDGYRVAQAEVRAFLDAGFTPRHYDLLAYSIVSTRAKRRSQKR